jgi:peptide/nickel transport system ATP-binding protein
MRDDTDSGATGEQPLLSVEGLEKHYPITEGLLQREVGTIRAVDGIDFTVEAGETVGLIGESGCGKSTAATSVLRLEEPTGGDIRFRGEDITEYSDGELRRFRRNAQVVFQNPSDAFNPRMTVGESIAEPLRVQGFDRRGERTEVVEDLLERVGLSAEMTDRYPHALSGGQKQRAALARSLVLNPDLLIADEPVSALDVSVKAEILALLRDLQESLDLGVLLISHDMGVVREVCDRAAVMYAGEVVERGPTEELFTDPAHPYTAALVDAVPTVDTGTRRTGGGLSGEVPDPANPPSGCRFHPRCPSVIPPERLDAEQDAFRAAVDLRLALDDDDIDRDAAVELAASEDSSPGFDPTETEVETEQDFEDAELKTAIRTEFGIPETVADETLEAAIAESIDAILVGNTERARDRLDLVTDSPCLTKVPETVSVDDDSETSREETQERDHSETRETDCHLHAEAVPRSEEEVAAASVSGESTADD